MTRVHHVKKARKDNKVHGIKKGDEYWWAGYRLGRSSFKRFWKSPPRASQVTASEFYSSLYSIQESMEDAAPDDMEELRSLMQDWISEIDSLREETQGKFDNMPEGLQQGDTGQLLQERIDALESWQSDLESVDLDEEPELEDDASDDKKEEAMDELVKSKLEEITSLDPGC